MFLEFREHKVRKNPCIKGVKIPFDPIIIIIDKNVILNTLYLFGMMGRYVTKIKLPITAKTYGLS